MTEKTLNWELTAPQYKFFNSPARYRAFISGIGAGKSAAGFMCGLKEAIQQPGSVGVIIAPTYPLIKDVLWAELDKWTPRELIKDFSRRDNVLRLTNGSVIRFRSAENDRQIERLRGPSVAWFWIDEATLVPKITWDIMIGHLRQIGYDCKAWITATPKGYNWIHQIFVKEPMPDSFILSGVSSRSNIYLDEGYFKSLESQYTGQFAAQELNGEFVRFEGLVYNFTPAMIVRELPDHFDKIIFGVDWGFRAPSCILAIGVKGESVYVLEEFYQSRVTDDRLVKVAQAFQNKYGVGPFFCDPSGAASIEKFHREGIDARKANNDINAGIRAMTAKIETNNFFVHQSCQNLINELNMYSYSDNDKDKPVKMYDHALDSCRYSIMSLSGGSEGIVFLGTLSEGYPGRERHHHTWAMNE